MNGAWKHAARAAFFYGGSLRILMYHRFPRTGSLEWQCRHLREHYRVMSLSAAARSLAGRHLCSYGPPMENMTQTPRRNKVVRSRPRWA